MTSAEIAIVMQAAMYGASKSRQQNDMNSDLISTTPNDRCTSSWAGIRGCDNRCLLEMLAAAASCTVRLLLHWLTAAATNIYNIRAQTDKAGGASFHARYACTSGEDALQRVTTGVRLKIKQAQTISQT